MLSMLLVTVALQGAAAATTPPKPDGYNDKEVCKHIDATGSRLGGKRICMTRGEWEARTNADREELQRVQGNAGSGGVRTY